MKVAVVGTGYVGLVAGAGFADFGNDVVCVDIDKARVTDLENGIMPIYEPGLEDLVSRNVARGRLSFSTRLADAVAGAQAVFVAVGTPPAADGHADLSYVLKAAEEIGAALTGWAVVVTKSTVPVGTADKVKEAVAANSKHEFSVASNPEFLKEGDAVNDFMKPARVVLGVADERASEVLKELYAPFVRMRNRIHVVDIRSAELIKYAANAMLATRVSFMNELALLAEEVGADAELVRVAVGADPRIGPQFLFHGPGFGGSCFPKDLHALVQTGREHDLDLWITEAAIRVNERQKKVLAHRVSEFFGGDLAGRVVAVWGLAFKPETDDVREAPAISVVRGLLELGASVRAYDPVATDNARQVLGDGVYYASDPYDAAVGADALVLVTEWRELRRPSFERLKSVMRGNALFDGRNVWNPSDVQAFGFHHYGIGRGVTSE